MSKNSKIYICLFFVVVGVILVITHQLFSNNVKKIISESRLSNNLISDVKKIILESRGSDDQISDGVKILPESRNSDAPIHVASRAGCIIDEKSRILERNNFQKLVEEKRNSSDGDVIDLLRKLTDLPSVNMLKRSNNLLTTPQAKTVNEIFKNKHRGFFVECGALDGERSSNTIVLETDQNWVGLLVEMDPFFYTQLLGKNRKSWSINACMSPFNFVSYLNYSEDISGRGQVLEAGLQGESAVIRKVPCFPLEAMLLSLNQSKVDYFSLDVEGLELEVLKTIPLDKLDITVLSVEHLHVVGGRAKLRSYMESQGYNMYKQIDHNDGVRTLYVHDMIFVKQKYLDSVR